MKLLKFCAAVMFASAVQSTHAGEFQNGSFESFDQGSANAFCAGGFQVCGQYDSGNPGITGWTIHGNSVDLTGTIWIASNGSWSIDLSGVNAGAISQTFDTVIGVEYSVDFDLGGNFFGGPPVKTGTVSAAGNSKSLAFDSSLSTSANMGWVAERFTFVAIATSTTLTFASTVSGNAGLALDNVSVSVSAVPEPASALLLLSGLSLTVFASRFAKKTSA